MIKVLNFLRSALLLSIFSVGCTTIGDISDVDRSLLEIRTAVISTVGDIRGTSQNRREFYSQYFSASKDPYFDPTTSEERLYAHITVLGDRRPYEIKVEVIVEEKIEDSDEYEKTSTDVDMADKIITSLRDRLNQKSNDRPVIDVFRIF